MKHHFDEDEKEIIEEYFKEQGDLNAIVNFYEKHAVLKEMMSIDVWRRKILYEFTKRFLPDDMIRDFCADRGLILSTTRT